ncbi:uncharacterized protein SCHCODRAFT_02007969 [Schizophyllum commune H4-8]|uniref:uncharacterized protein n=1 Tax=Schizophyllum commune (strain H4-8 / FGSC 9210) TaxID=578458 RepID=UPI00216043C0|nr:uncharacterized protein SCHCODRAFT_02007969 [Schizophyllum commune H4-8]KAI5899293.1 hypothetical protein SCHCODRAFT_02007969 [Schizophyllum commune H4-8]
MPANVSAPRSMSTTHCQCQSTSSTMVPSVPVDQACGSTTCNCSEFCFCRPNDCRCGSAK